MLRAIGVVEVLASKIILKMRYRLFFNNLVVENKARGVVEGSIAKLKTELKVESLSSLPILLSIGEKAHDIRAMKGAIEARFLLKHPKFLTKIILIILK